MRPRFLINFINHCKSFAVNLNHDKITEADITKGYQAYSSDILTDVSLEIRDIFPETDNLLAVFYLSKSKLSRIELQEILSKEVANIPSMESIIDTLLWYGFLGVVGSDKEVSYIFNANYNIDLLKAIIKKDGDSVLFIINPCFWPSLHIQTC